MRSPGETHLPEGTLFVGDLHLDVADAARVEEFVQWCSEVAARCARVVILGDLFEYWIGDGQLDEPGAQRVSEALARLTRAGVEVDLVPGNRDFLVGERFRAATGIRLWPAGLIGSLPGGERVLVLHGDELCTRDRAYQRLRRVLRFPPVSWVGQHLPRAVAHRAAERLRQASRGAVARKPSAEKALQPEAGREFLEQLACRVLVCGHVHEARDQDLGDGRRLLVVDAFGGARDAVRVGAGGELHLEGAAQGSRS